MSFDNYDKCSLLLPMNGSNGGTTFTDWSPNTKTVTVNGNAQTSTAQFKYYDSSGYFDGTGDYLTATNSGNFDVSGDMTIAAWVRSETSDTTNVKAICNTRPASGNGWWTLTTGNASNRTLALTMVNASGTTILNLTTTTTIATSTFTHVAAVRVGTAWTLYVNGVNSASGSESGTPGTTSNFTIGRDLFNTARDWNGYMQDLIVVKGAALWTADFTPPTRLIGTISGNVKDAAGDNASRTIHAVPRSYPSRLFSTTSDPSTGNYSLSVPATECSRIALADEATLYNDIIDRVIPE